MKRLFLKLIQFSKNVKFPIFSTVSITGIGGLSYFIYNHRIKFTETPISIPAYALSANERSDNNISRKRKFREERFLDFASFECNGEVYMTPADFLESVTQNHPRYRTNRHVITVKEAKRMVRNTPSRRSGSKDLFRSLDKEGLISYTEYLFLLGVLTKPRSGFKIAFNMFDTDMNEEVDKIEFLVMERTMQNKKAEVAENHKAAMESKKAEKTWFLFKLLHKAIVGVSTAFETNENLVEEVIEAERNDTSHDNENVNKFTLPPEMEFDTTMLVIFFGKSGKDKLRFSDFSRFMENLQTEVLEIEFLEFSKGLKTISESEFAKILLRYTTVDDTKHDAYCERVLKKMSNEKGITFEDFKAFFQFLNNLEDFILAMKMYTLVDRPISQQEFHQAVKACTNMTLSSQLVQTIFFLFDEDNDGFLSYNEFIKSMKNRMNRGFSSTSTKLDFSRRFKYCVSDELNKSY